MNRIIKFRGKDLETKRWLYGGHFNDGAEDYILPNLPSGTVDYEYYQVDQNTIGQFTGLIDRNGREIYEGDILKTKGNWGDVVRWHCNGYFYLKSLLYDEDEGSDVTPLGGLSAYQEKRLEIIGNEFDNLDLIKLS